MATNNSINCPNPSDVACGGTGRATLTDGALLLGDGTNAVEMLAMTTKGQLLAGDGTTSPQMLSVGSNDQILVADSAEVTGLKWAAANSLAGGAWTFISKTVVSSASSVDLTSLTGDIYAIHLRNILPDTEDGTPYLRIRVTDDGGSTWESVDYMFTNFNCTLAGLTTETNNSASRMNLTPADSGLGIGIGTGEFGASGWVFLSNFNDSANPVHIGGSLRYCSRNNGEIAGNYFNGVACDDVNGGSTLDADGAQLSFSGADIASGDVILYSIAEA